ncbi:hypothetical protein ACH5BF_03125 [Arcobacter sp. YIC-464]|uniref:hypothetical protein n=1 Tax=Arcobacter sp. YIC-464 TaxID=3376631 RepID=UPI003C249177
MIIKFKSIKNWQNHIYYLFNEDKHLNQEIVSKNFFKNYNLNQEIIDSFHFGKNGRRSRMLSVVISFKKGISKIDAESRFKKVYLDFYIYVNNTYALGLDIDELKELVYQIPFVYHGKEDNPHFHTFLNRVIYSKKENKYISIDFSKKTFVNKFRQLAGWDLKKDISKSKTKNNYTYKIEQLEKEILKYKNISSKLDKYIAIALRDLKNNRTDNALKKLKKIRQRNTL